MSFEVRYPPDIRSLQIGSHQAVLIDNFLVHPEAMVDAARAAQFEPYPKLAEGKGYPGIRARAPQAYSLNLTELMEPLIKLNFNVPEELGLRKSMCAFSLTTQASRDLGPLQRTPHFDTSTPHHMAVLLYLCDESQGGTGFYQHKATGYQQITAANRDHYLDVYAQETARHAPPQKYFDADTEEYRFLGMIPAKFNRLVIYRGSLLHTAIVNEGKGLSANPARGRLTVNTFYDFGVALDE